MQTSIADNLAQVRQRIQAAEQRYQRTTGSVKLLAVSKKHSIAAIKQAISAGHRCFGENYLQEAISKITALSNQELEWHFIGSIQANKTAAIAEHFSWVHSVENFKVAHRLSEQRPSTLAKLNVCLQVNVSNDPNKSGVALADLTELASTVQTLPNLDLRGLMTIPSLQASQENPREPFILLKKALQQLSQQGVQLDTLSMGMSADLEAAIAEGATVVRVGTDIFGPRSH